MIRSTNRRGKQVTVRSQMVEAVEQFRAGTQPSISEALAHSLATYARERPEVLVLTCLALGFLVGRRLSL